MNFREKLEEQWKQGKFLCVGLDVAIDKMPSSLKHPNALISDQIGLFNQAIIEATARYAAAYKPNLAFYGQYGPAGWYGLEKTIKMVEETGAVLILDGKRADIGNTNDAYATELFDQNKADVVTVNPYFGGGSLEPFLKRTDKGVFVLCRTTGAESGEFQDRMVALTDEECRDWNFQPGEHVPLYQLVARKCIYRWNKNGNCGLVVGALTPNELKIVRDIVGDDVPFLVPGIRKQGGIVSEVVRNAVNSVGNGFVINSSRDIIYASDGPNFAEAAGAKAKEIHEEIQRALTEAA